MKKLFFSLIMTVISVIAAIAQPADPDPNNMPGLLTSGSVVTYVATPVLNVTLNKTTLCFGDSLFVTTSGGYTNITFQFDAGPINPMSSWKGVLTAGNHTLTVVGNDGGCPTTIVRNITVHPQIVSSAIVTNSAGCGGSTGSISITTNASTPSFKWYSMVPSQTLLALTTANSGNTLAHNTYKTVITDINSCKDSLVNVVSDAAAPALTWTLNDSTFCYSDTIRVNASAGFSTYNFQVDGVSVQNSASVSWKGVITPGNHTLSLTAITAGGCNANKSTTNINIAPQIPTSDLPNTISNVCGVNTAVLTTTSIVGANYQWYQYNGTTWSAIVNGASYSGATTNTLNILDVSGMNNRRIVARVNVPFTIAPRTIQCYDYAK